MTPLQIRHSRNTIGQRLLRFLALIFVFLTASVCATDDAVQQLLDKADEQYRSGELEAVLSTVQEILARDPTNAKAWHYRGHCYADTGRTRDAIEAYSKSIDLSPDSAHVFLLRSTLYDQLNLYEDAWSDALMAHLLDPSNDRMAFQLGRVSYFLFQHDDALRMLSHAITLNPDAAHTYYVRGRTYKDMGDFENALEDIDRAMQIASGSSNLYEERGDIYRLMGLYDKAAADVQTALSIDPEDALALNTRGMLHYDLEAYEAAVRDLQAAIDRGMNHPDTYSYLGASLELLGDLEKALEQYDRSVALAPEDDVYHSLRGDILVKLGRYDEARAAYTSALSMHPTRDDAIIGYVRTYVDEAALDEGHAHIESLLADERSKQNVLLKATLHAQAHEYGPAIELFEEALTLSAPSEWEFVMLVDLHWDNGDTRAALNAADRYLSRFPDSYDAFHWRYSVLNQLDRYQDALEMAQEMVRLREDAFSYELVGYIQYSLGEFEQAIESLKTSEALGSDSADTPGYHGLSLYSMNKFDECLVYLDEAVERAGDAASYWLWWRAEVHEEMDNPDLAMADYDLALTLTPDHTGLLESRAELKFELGDFEAAYADFQKIIAIEPENEDAWLRSIDAKVESGNIFATFFEFYRYGAAKNASTQGEEPFLDFIDRYGWVLANAVFLFGVALVGLTVVIVLHRQKKASQPPKP